MRHRPDDARQRELGEVFQAGRIPFDCHEEQPTGFKLELAIDPEVTVLGVVCEQGANIRGVALGWQMQSDLENMADIGASQMQAISRGHGRKGLDTGELLGDWQAMLGHQLPMLPPFESYWTALPEFFDWLQGGAPAAELAIAPIAAQETVFRPAVGTLRRQGWAGSSHLEIIRFAASNHLCVDLGYQHSIRRIEPYSLRRTQAGDILLYAVKTDTGESRSYRLDRIENAQATSQVFKPRYAVELTPTETGPIPLAVRRVGASGVPHMQPIRSSTRGSAFQAHGPMFIYQCAVCGRKFERKTTDSTLRPHKTVQGWPCSGRTGWLVETRYQ